MAILDSEYKMVPKKAARSEDKLLLSRREAAARLSISPRSLDYLISDGVIPVRRIGSRVLIPYEHLLFFASRDYRKRLVS
jgi:excisionase family DNA binding protein